MALALATMYSEEEYLRLENDAAEKSEFFQGNIVMMAGAAPNHNRIKENIVGELYTVLKKKSCKSYSSDQRIHIPSNSLSVAMQFGALAVFAKYPGNVLPVQFKIRDRSPRAERG